MSSTEAKERRDAVRVLALNHYFDQDLAALEAQPDLALRRVPYQRLRRHALRIMGEEVGTGLEYFTRPELASARDRYAHWLKGEFRRMFLEYPFDLLVLPGDTFFFVRALPEIAHSINVPVAVVQKETTISPETMENWSLSVKRYAPFISDWMTVCSDRQREFWRRAATPIERITVTGQPRFDIYGKATPPKPSPRPKVLFFSYAVDAYAPEDERGRDIWIELRQQTEAVLAELAIGGYAHVVVKHHPQQSRRGELERLRATAGEAWGKAFAVADSGADTRRLILDADIVVGFQTTALYESAAAQRPVVYAAWGKAWEERVKNLIPFHAAPAGCLHHAKNPESLRAMLQSELPPPSRDARLWYEEALGPVDGMASARAADVLTRLASHRASHRAPKALVKHRRRFAAGLMLRKSAAEAFWLGAALPAAAVGRSGSASFRRQSARELRNLAGRALLEGGRPYAEERSSRRSRTGSGSKANTSDSQR